MIAVAGDALLDAHADGDALRLFPGHGPFNTAVALARLGVPACFLGAISTDRFAQRLEQALRSVGVEMDSIVRLDAPTPIAIVDSTPTEASFSVYPAGTAHEALRLFSVLSAAALRRHDGGQLGAALAYAVVVAALQCTRPNAWGPTAKDVEEFRSERGSTTARTAR